MSEYIILFHAIFAYMALFLGGYVLFVRKGDSRHKKLGKAWVLFMCVVAFSGLFITEINPPYYSPVHLLIPFTLVSLYLGVRKIRAYRITGDSKHYKKHRKYMLGCYIGLCVAGMLAFLIPGRTLSNF